MSARQAAKPRPDKPNRPRPKAAPRPRRAPKAKAVDEAPEPAGDDIDEDERVPELSAVGDDKTGGLKEDPALDRRIIEGMLDDRKQLLEDLAKDGMTQQAVLRRAAELGLSEALLRQVKGVAADLAGERPGRRPAPSSLGARTCLSCDRVFLSTGPGNRLCMRCRGGDAGLAQF